MGLDLGPITIKVDPGASLAAVKGVEAGLKGVETAGKQTQSALSGLGGSFKSLASALEAEDAALKRLVSSQDAQLASMNAAARASTTWQAALLREREMLESIHGPAQKLRQDTEALNALMAKGAITADQYAAALANSKASAGGQQPTGATGMISGLGAAGQAAVAGGAGVAVVAAGRAVEGLINDYRQLDDEYTTLINHEMKFVDETHSLTAVQQQQLELSTALHTTMKESIEVYDAVGDALVDMNLSSRDLATITKVVGQEAEISGKSMASAGDVLNRLTLAMDSGVGAGRALKSALTGYDAITDTLERHFHTTRAGLIALADAGKLGPKEIVEALKAEADQVQKNYDQRNITHEKLIAQVNEQANVLRHQGVGALMAYTSAGTNAADELRRATDTQYAQQKAMDETLPTIEQLTKDLENMSGGFQKVGDVSRKAMDGAVTGVQDLVDEMAKLNRELPDLLAKLVPLGAKTAGAYRDATAENIQAINDLNAAYAAGAIPTGEFFLRMEQLTAGIKAQKDALKDHREAVKADVGEFASILAAGMDPTKSLREAHAASGAASRQADLEYASSSSEPLTQTAAAAEKYRLELAQLSDMIERNVVDQDQAAARLKMINLEYNKNLGAVDAYTQRQHELQAMLDSIKKPQEDYTRDLALAKQLYEDGAIKAQEYADKVAAIRDAYNSTQKHSTDFATGLEHGWNDIVKEATDSAGQIETAMKGAFGAIEDSLTNMVMKGQFDLSSLGSSLEQILVKLAVQQAIGGIVGAIGPVGGGRTGFDYMTPGGSGPVFPGFATGGDMLVGGSGGPDSKLAMFHVSPGETIHVRTPEQRAAAAEGGRGGGVTHNHFYTYDPKALNKDIRSAIGNEIQQNRARYRSLLGV